MGNQFETDLFVVPIGGKYGRWICPNGCSGFWDLSVGSGWCGCGFSLNATGGYRPAFGSGPSDALWVRAHLDAWPDLETETPDQGGDR